MDPGHLSAEPVPHSPPTAQPATASGALARCLSYVLGMPSASYAPVLRVPPLTVKGKEKNHSVLAGEVVGR